MKMQFLKIKLFILAAMLGCFNIAGTAQTGAYTYQGRLVDATVPQPTNGTYEMQFKLYNAAQNGAQIGNVQTILTVQVVNGIFTVQLDAENSFNGADLFIEIGMRPAGSQAALTTLAPRQQVTSAPYAVQSRNALTANDSNKLGGIDASQYVTGQVIRSVNNLTNDVTLAAGNNITITPAGSTLTIASTGGVNNQTNLQTGANFNIEGTGAAHVFNAATQFNIGGNRFLSGGGGNIFAGVNAGATTNTGLDNSFFGTRAGLTNASGNNNAFFGADAGHNNTASNNSFFGRSAGYDNTTGTSNAFFGLDAGRFNMSGSQNSFFGTSAGRSNLTAQGNSFFGYQAGTANTIGSGNTFVGMAAGQSNVDGKFNVFVGAQAGQNNTSGIDNDFVGNGSGFLNQTGSDNAFFGHASGRKNVSGNENSFFGRDAGSENTASQNSFFGFEAGTFNQTGTRNAYFGYKSGFVGEAGDDNSFFGYQAGMVTTGGGNTFIGANAGSTTTTGTDNVLIGNNARGSGSSNTSVGTTANANGSGNVLLGLAAGVTGNNNTIIGNQAGSGGTTVNSSIAIGSGAKVITSNTIVLGTAAETTKIPGALSVSGKVGLTTLGAAGSTSLCRNASNEISTCTPGNLAQPDDNKNIGALDSLREENRQLRRQLEEQQVQLEELKQTVCMINPAAKICGK